MLSLEVVEVGAEDVEEEDTMEANALVAADAFEETGGANDVDEADPENEKGDAAKGEEESEEEEDEDEDEEEEESEEEPVQVQAPTKRRV